MRLVHDNYEWAAFSGAGRFADGTDPFFGTKVVKVDVRHAGEHFSEAVVILDAREGYTMLSLQLVNDESTGDFCYELNLGHLPAEPARVLSELLLLRRDVVPLSEEGILALGFRRMGVWR